MGGRTTSASHTCPFHSSFYRKCGAKISENIAFLAEKYWSPALKASNLEQQVALLYDYYNVFFFSNGLVLDFHCLHR